MAVSPGPINARHMWLKPSLLPKQDNRLRFGIQSHTVLAKVLVSQFAAQIQQAIGLAVAVIATSSAASQSFSIISFSGGSEGLPMPRSITSCPAGAFDTAYC